MSYLQKLFPSTAVPALLLGLSSNALKNWIPDPLQTWTGRISLFLLFASALVYVLLLSVHRIVPRRFANLVYLVDDAMNVAMIEHPFHKRIQPPGSRLGYHEAPHQAVLRVVKDELGLSDPERLSFVPSVERSIGKVKIVPCPVQVQVERRKQRLGVSEHYDFVYLCRIPGTRPRLQSSLNPAWMSLAEIRQAAASDAQRAPFEDVIPTVEELLHIVGPPPASPNKRLQPAG
jgi:ADP-ribose pyrophosphatase YjhB (NUDIX family)